MSRVVVTERRMKKSVMDMASVGRGGAGRKDADFRVGGEAFLAFGDHVFAGVEAGADDGLFGLAGGGVEAKDGDVANGDSVLRFVQHPDELAAGAGLDGLRIDEHAGGFDAKAGADVDELAGPENAVGIGEAGFEFDGAGGGVDGAIDEGQRAGGDAVTFGESGDGHGPFGLVFADLWEEVFGDGECDVDGGGLEEGDEGVVVLFGKGALLGGDDAGAAGDGGVDFGVVDEEASFLEAGAVGAFGGFRAFDGGAAGIDGGFGGVGIGGGLVGLFAGEDALLFQLAAAAGDGVEIFPGGLIAIDVGFGLFGVGLIAGDVGLDFGELADEGFGVEGEEELAFADVLAFDEVDVDDGGGDASFDFDGGAGFDVADGGDFEGDVGRGGLDGADGLGGRNGGRGGGCFAGAGQGEGQEEDQSELRHV